MKKSQSKKVTEKTEGDQAVIVSKKRMTQMISEKINEGHRDVFKDESVDKTLKTPKWLKKENTIPYLKMIQLLVSAQFNDISKFSRENKVSRQTIYEWLKSPDTKDLVDEFIKALAVADKAKVYQMILAKVPDNPGFARLWMERYEGYRPEEPRSGNVTINFNFLDPPKKPVKEAEDAEYEEQ